MTEEPAHARATGLVWRRAADRVLVRRVGDHSDRAASELTGAAALVWLALETPLPRAPLRAELAASGAEDPDTELDRALGLLRDHDLISGPDP
jgi:hypothetical protein